MKGYGMHNVVEVAGEVHDTTKRAYLFYDGVRQVWLPLSQCEWDEESKVMTMPEWLAIEKELV